MENSAPQVKVHKHAEYHVKQSPVMPQHLAHTPYRMTLLGASGQGKTQFLQSWILDLMPQHDRYYIISHSIHQDPMWDPVKAFIERKLKAQKVHPTKVDPPLYYDTYDRAALQKIIDTQHEMVKLAKRQGLKQMPSICVILDDMLDDKRLMTSTGSETKLLNQLYIRGRHDFISCVTSVQRFSPLNNIVKSQSTAYVCYRLRSQSDLDSLCEELSGVYPGGKKTIEAIYRMAVGDQPFSFLYCNLMARTPENTFWLRFEKRLVPKEIDEDATQDEPEHQPPHQ